MRGMFSVLGVLLVVAIVGLLAKKQFSQMTRTPVAPPPVSAPGDGPPAVPGGSPQQQLREVQQSVEKLMQQPRPMPEDK